MAAAKRIFGEAGMRESFESRAGQLQAEEGGAGYSPKSAASDAEST
jgi:hypothetical protein